MSKPEGPAMLTEQVSVPDKNEEEATNIRIPERMNRWGHWNIGTSISLLVWRVCNGSGEVPACGGPGACLCWDASGGVSNRGGIGGRCCICETSLEL